MQARKILVAALATFLNSISAFLFFSYDIDS